MERPCRRGIKTRAQHAVSSSSQRGLAVLLTLTGSAFPFLFRIAVSTVPRLIVHPETLPGAVVVMACLAELPKPVFGFIIRWHLFLHSRMTTIRESCMTVIRCSRMTTIRYSCSIAILSLCYGWRFGGWDRPGVIVPRLLGGIQC